LHLAVLVVAPGCGLAGWWQATRALAGNELSWVYSVEWPVFALIAVGGWWHLIHEDEGAYRARKQHDGGVVPPPATDRGAGGTVATARRRPVVADAAGDRLSTALAVLVAIELAVGVAVVLLVPLARPSGWLPPRGAAIYLLHAVLGLPLAVGALALLVRTRASDRIARLSGRIGASGVVAAAGGGAMCAEHPLRLAGMALMLAGGVVAGFGYLFRTLEKLED
jgi:hypothetical protein